MDQGHAGPHVHGMAMLVHSAPPPYGVPLSGCIEHVDQPTSRLSSTLKLNRQTKYQRAKCKGRIKSRIVLS